MSDLPLLKKHLAAGGHISSIEPWRASGPGWSNQGVRLVVACPGKKDVKLCLYGEDLGAEAAALWRVAEVAYTDLLNAIDWQARK